MTPEYLSSLVPPTVGSTVRYNLGNESDLQTVPAKSQQYFNSFLPQLRESGTDYQRTREIPNLLQLSKVN